MLKYGKLNLEKINKINERILRKINEKKEELKKCKPLLKFVMFLHGIEREEEAIEFLLSLRWFRGEACKYKSALMPSLFRKLKENDPKSRDKLKAIEAMMVFEALNNQQIFMFINHLSDKLNLELFSILKHYDNPSRLLDFSRDFKIALFFAAKPCKEEKGNVESAAGVVYILYPRLLNLQISLGTRAGLIPSKGDYISVRARVKYGTLYYPSIGALFAIINFDKRTFLGDLNNLKSLEMRDIENLIEKIKKKFKEKEFFRIFSTPIAVNLEPYIDLISNQKATSVVFGGMGENNIFTSLKDFESKNREKRKYLKDWYLPYIICNKLILPYDFIEIKPAEKECIRRALKLQGYDEYRVFAKDPRYLYEHAEYIYEDNLNP